MGTPAPDAVKRLVDRFDQDRKVFLSGDYTKEQLRAGVLTPLFDSVGWDITNKAGLTECIPMLAVREAGASRPWVCP